MINLIQNREQSDGGAFAQNLQTIHGFKNVDYVT
jgi:hypothetical protein